MLYKKILILFYFVLLPLSLFNGCYSWYHGKPIGESEVKAAFVDPNLKQISVKSADIKHPVLKPVSFSLQNGISPDEAAIIAVYANPQLKVERSRLGIASAQVTQSGILPNPEFTYSLDSPVGGNKIGAFNAYGFGLSWEVTSLISLYSKIQSKKCNRDSVEVDIAWKEFVTAQNSRIAIYKNIILGKQEELLQEWSDEIDSKLGAIRKGVEKGVATELTLSSVLNMKNDVHSALLKKHKEREVAMLASRKILGFSPFAELQIENVPLPQSVKTASIKQYMDNIRKRRLDLVALMHGYESQEEAVMVAILEQIPRVNIGMLGARDSGNLKTLGLGVAVSVPLFDRNQGHIAIERAVREKLYREYMFRMFTVRADIAKLLTLLQELNRQVEQYEKVIPEQRLLLQQYKRALLNGHGDILVYFSIMKELITRELKLLNLQYELIVDKINLATASGYYNSEDVLNIKKEKNPDEN